MEGLSLWTELSHKDLDVTVMTVIMAVTATVTVVVAVIVAVTLVVGGVDQMVENASNVASLAILPGSAHLGMVEEGTDMLVEMTGMVAAAAAAAAVTVVMDLTVAVKGILGAIGMVGAAVGEGIDTIVIGPVHMNVPVEEATVNGAC